jgi:predicted dithiol-disulfide oxidoreductase (DUF899 family)
MYAEREISGPASLSILAMRSSDRVRDVFAFILPLYYQSRARSILGWSTGRLVSTSPEGRRVEHQRLRVADSVEIAASARLSPAVSGEESERLLPVTDSFDADFGVAEYHGHNVFIRDGERVFRTYFVNSRGDEAMGSTWSYLDITPLGRQEIGEESPEGYHQTRPYKWWNGTTLMTLSIRPTRMDEVERHQKNHLPEVR